MKAEVLLLSVVSLLCAVLFNQFSGRGIAWIRKAPALARDAGTTSNEDLSSPGENIDPNDPTLTKASPRFVTIAQARQFHQQQKAVFLDAREPERFAAGHVAGAHNLPLYQPENWPMILRQLAHDQVIITYCDEDCDSARRLALALIDSGYVAVYVLDKGYDSWRNAGGAVVESQ